MVIDNNNDEITVNQHNDKITAKFLFYINLSKHNIINIDKIIDLLCYMQLYIINLIKTDNYKLSEFITNYIFIFIDNLYNEIKIHSKYHYIIDNINIIKLYKKNECENPLFINNKVKFKHYDMYDKLQK